MEPNHIETGFKLGPNDQLLKSHRDGTRTLSLLSGLGELEEPFRKSLPGEGVRGQELSPRPFRTLSLLGEEGAAVSEVAAQLSLVEVGDLLAAKDLL